MPKPQTLVVLSGLLLVACAPSGDLVDGNSQFVITDTDADTDADADSDSDTDADADTDIQDTDTDTDTDSDLPCDEANFPPVQPNEIDFRWLGLIQDGNLPCPVADQGWTSGKLFPGAGGEMGRYCLYSWNPQAPPELCGLPYDGQRPPWQWLERDSFF